MQDTEKAPRLGAVGLTRWPLFALLLFALVVRLPCLAPVPFFADVPDNVAAIESGRMHIQFPGYVPFHLLVLALRPLVSGTFGAMVLFSVLCGLLAMFYIARAAELFGGRDAGLIAAAVAGCGLIGTYFSVVGSSYTTDLLAVSGAIYHGLRLTRHPGDSRHALWAVLWCCFGLLMRPLSGMWMAPAAIYLVWKYGGMRERSGAAIAIAATIVAGIALSAPYFGTMETAINSTLGLRAAATDALNRNQLAAAIARLAGFPLYFFHVWLVVGAVAVWRARRRGFSRTERDAGVFLLILGAPYCVVLLRHIPQAGYLCYLAPLIVICPLIFRQVLGRGVLVFAAAGFAVVGLAQLFLLRPVAPSSSASVIADAYFLQYSRAAIKAGSFETLTSLALKAGVLDQELPDKRREDVLLRKTK